MTNRVFICSNNIPDKCASFHFIKHFWYFIFTGKNPDTQLFWAFEIETLWTIGRGKQLEWTIRNAFVTILRSFVSSQSAPWASARDANHFCHPYSRRRKLSRAITTATPIKPDYGEFSLPRRNYIIPPTVFSSSILSATIRRKLRL